MHLHVCVKFQLHTCVSNVTEVMIVRGMMGKTGLG